MTYTIVGDYEGDVKQGRISVSAPLARAMIGREQGEAVTLKRMGSGVGQGDGGSGGGGGGGWAHAPRAVNALAKTADIKECLFMVRRQGACQHHVSYATGERVPSPQP